MPFLKKSLKILSLLTIIRTILVPDERHPKGLIQSPGIEIVLKGVVLNSILPLSKQFNRGSLQFSPNGCLSTGTSIYPFRLEARTIVLEMKNQVLFDIVLRYRTAVAMLSFTQLSTDIEQATQKQYKGQEGVVAPNFKLQKS